MVGDRIPDRNPFARQVTLPRRTFQWRPAFGQTTVRVWAPPTRAATGRLVDAEDGAYSRTVISITAWAGPRSPGKDYPRADSRVGWYVGAGILAFRLPLQWIVSGSTSQLARELLQRIIGWVAR